MSHGAAMTGALRGGNPPALIVAGPTCSGKSALALALARAWGGIVINADAMQTYRDLRILTARPTAAEEEAVPHALYGYRDASDAGGAASWRRAALHVMAAAHAAGRLPILCGGTGLYFAALIDGLADIPPPGAEARAEARALLKEIGAPALHARLALVDEATAARLRPSDGQRLARAWEVWRGTGTGLAEWQARAAPAPAPYRFLAFHIDPPREALRAAIALRFASMLDQGALAEVERLLARSLDPGLPLLRAHGVPELGVHLRGLQTLPASAARAVAATVAYTKRQATWFRHHPLAGPLHIRTLNARVEAPQQFSESFMAVLQNFLQSTIDPHDPPP